MRVTTPKSNRNKSISPLQTSQPNKSVSPVVKVSSKSPKSTSQFKKSPIKEPSHEEQIAKLKKNR